MILGSMLEFAGLARAASMPVTVKAFYALTNKNTVALPLWTPFRKGFAFSRSLAENWPRAALPKKRCLELSSLNKCWSFERLKVPDTFFWGQPTA